VVSVVATNAWTVASWADASASGPPASAAARWPGHLAAMTRADAVDWAADLAGYFYLLPGQQVDPPRLA
jgi:hypothetical protein